MITHSLLVKYIKLELFRHNESSVCPILHQVLLKPYLIVQAYKGYPCFT